MATKTVVIKPGETIILPKDAVISSLVYDGSITVESSCDNLPTPSNYKCGAFFIIIDADSNSNHSMDMDTKYKQVIVGDTTYSIDEFVAYGDGNSPSVMPISVLNTHISDQALFKFTAITTAETDKHTNIYLFFKVPEEMFDSTWLVVDNRGFNSLQYYKGIEFDCGSYPDPT